MRGERRTYSQGIKVGHLHVSQRLLSMIVAQEFEGISSELFITSFELKLRHSIRIYMNFSFVVFQVELKFRVGDIIYVYGDLDEDGFFTVSEITLH